MQDSFQEKRRTSALRSHPTWILRALAVGVVAAVLGAVFLSVRNPRPTSQGDTPSPGEAGAAASGSPGLIPADARADRLDSLVFESFSSSGKKGIELEAQGSSGRESERRFLDRVKARVPFVSAGKPASLEIIADRAEHLASRPSALFEGNVKLTTDDGLILETEALFYDGYDGRAQSEGKVAWRRKNVSGEAVGMLYEGASDAITFFRSVKIRLRDRDDPPADIDADSACLSRGENALFLDGNVRVNQGENKTRSGSLQLFFGDDRAIYRAVFRDGFELVAAGDTGALGFSFPRAGGRKTIRGRRLDMTFSASRRPEEVAAGPEAVMVVEPAKGEAPERREIRGDALIFKFDQDGKLKEYLGNSGTSVRFLPLNPRTGDLRTISATDFVATVDPSIGEAEKITFVEKVVFERKGQRGKGDKAEFSEKTGRMVVSGGAAFDDSDGRISLVASSIDMDTRTGSFRAWGGVRHTQKGGLKGAPFGTPGADLLATSRQVIHDAPRKATQYLDRVVFRAGEDEMRALTIETADSPKGPKITAETEVEILVAGGAAAAGIDARSTRMVYTPADRTFTFSGAASVRQKGFLTEAPEILVSLGSASDFAVETLEAKGGPVTIRAEERSAQGDHLLYTPKDGRVVIQGAPVKLESQGKRIQGKSVRFFTSGDQVEVVGEEGRTETVLQRKIKQ